MIEYVNKYNNQTMSLEKVEKQFTLLETNEKTIQFTFSFKPKKSRVKQTNVTLTFLRFFDTDALALTKVEVDKRTDEKKTIYEVKEHLVTMDIFSETYKHGNFLVKTEHNYTFFDMRDDQFFRFIVLEEIPDLELVLQHKETKDALYLSSNHKLYYFSRNVSADLEKEDYRNILFDSNIFGPIVKLQENGDVYIEIADCKNLEQIGIFEPRSEKAEVPFNRHYLHFEEQGEKRFLCTLEEVIALSSVSKEKKEEYREKIDSQVFPMEIEQYVLYSNIFNGIKKELLQDGDWIQRGSDVYKVMHEVTFYGKQKFEKMSLYKPGTNPFRNEGIYHTDPYKRIEKPEMKKIEQPFICEMVITGQNGSILFGEVTHESELCYFVTPYFVDKEDYFEVIYFMARNNTNVREYFESFQNKNEKHDAIYEKYHRYTDAPYGTIAVEKDNVKKIQKEQLKGLDRIANGFNIQEKIFEFIFHNHGTPMYVLGNLIIEENIGDEELLRLASVLSENPYTTSFSRRASIFPEEPYKDLLKQAFKKYTNVSVSQNLELFPEETYYALRDLLTTQKEG